MTGEGSTATYSVTSTGSLAPIDTSRRSERFPVGRWSPRTRSSRSWSTRATVLPRIHHCLVHDQRGREAEVPRREPAADEPYEYLKTDEFITPDGKYLYVVGHHATSPAGPATDSYLDEYKIASNGVLVPLGSTSPPASRWARTAWSGSELVSQQ